MKYKRIVTLLLVLMVGMWTHTNAQIVHMNGKVIDSESRLPLDEVQVNLYHNDVLLTNTNETDRNGKFEFQLPDDGVYRIELIRPSYERFIAEFHTKSQLNFSIEFPMSRLEGYEFIGTIKQFLTPGGELGKEISDTRIEIYNRSQGFTALDIPLNRKPHFGFNFERGTRYVVLIRKQGYFAKRFDVVVDIDGCILCFEGLGSDYSPNILEDLTAGNKKGVLVGEIPLRKINIDEAVRLDNIYYDYDKWTIRPDARPALDKLVQIMRTTPIVIELGSHTDSRGKFEYNQTLSQKRAEAAVSYITSKGIDTNRISAKGYGESQLINQCADDVICSEKDHQLNRRTEFKVTKMMTSSTFDNKTLQAIIELEDQTKRREIELLRVD